MKGGVNQLLKGAWVSIHATSTTMQLYNCNYKLAYITISADMAHFVILTWRSNLLFAIIITYLISFWIPWAKKHRINYFYEVSMSIIGWDITAWWHQIYNGFLLCYTWVYIQVYTYVNELNLQLGKLPSTQVYKEVYNKNASLQVVNLVHLLICKLVCKCKYT